MEGGVSSLPQLDYDYLPFTADLPPPPTTVVSKRKPKVKRKRHNEFDGNGEWTDVRRFDRMPITTDAASELEKMAGIPPGAYFVSLARKRLVGIINLHSRYAQKKTILFKVFLDGSKKPKIKRALMQSYSPTSTNSIRKHSGSLTKSTLAL